MDPAQRLRQAEQRLAEALQLRLAYWSTFPDDIIERCELAYAEWQIARSLAS